MRRVPCPIEVSATMITAPMSPLLPTWVPPQSSRDQPPKSTTRTSSPYFSPKSAIAPVAWASATGISRTLRTRLSRTAALMRRSTL
jgi:hypothetical protein